MRFINHMKHRIHLYIHVVAKPFLHLEILVISLKVGSMAKLVHNIATAAIILFIVLLGEQGN